jgi:hypothetical protein
MLVNLFGSGESSHTISAGRIIVMGVIQQVEEIKHKKILAIQQMFWQVRNKIGR